MAKKSKLGQTISIHRKLARELQHQKIQDYSKDPRVPKYIGLGEEIVLALSGLKCENCSSSEKITLHHLIEKKNKKCIPKQKYIVQRYFYMNIVVLCFNCHKKIHGIECKSGKMDNSFLKHHGKPIRNAKQLLEGQLMYTNAKDRIFVLNLTKEIIPA